MVLSLGGPRREFGESGTLIFRRLRAWGWCCVTRTDREFSSVDVCVETTCSSVVPHRVERNLTRIHGGDHRATGSRCLLLMPGESLAGLRDETDSVVSRAPPLVGR